MKISLDNLIKEYGDKLGYLGTSYGKHNKQYLQVKNLDFAITLVFHYNNIKVVKAQSEFAPEIKKTFITLK